MRASVLIVIYLAIYFTSTWLLRVARARDNEYWQETMKKVSRRYTALATMLFLFMLIYLFAGVLHRTFGAYGFDPSDPTTGSIGMLITHFMLSLSFVVIALLPPDAEKPWYNL